MAEASIETAAKARAVSEAREHALEQSEEQRRRVEAEVAARVAEVTRVAVKGTRRGVHGEPWRWAGRLRHIG